MNNDITEITRQQQMPINAIAEFIDRCPRAPNEFLLGWIVGVQSVVFAICIGLLLI